MEAEGASLGQREIDLLQHIADGHTVKEAAALIPISFEQARIDLKLSRAKLGARKTTHAVAIALRRGLID